MTTGSERFIQAASGVHVVAASAGGVAFLLIWLATVSGIVLRNGWIGTTIRHSTLVSLHMMGATLGLALGVLHGLTQLAAPVHKVRLVDVAVPFGNPYDPIGIGVGVLGTEIMLAVAISVTVQRRLGFARWRLLHNLNHVAFMLLVGHILISGSDVGPPAVWMSVLGSWLVVVLLWLLSAATGWGVGGARRGVAGGARAEVSVQVDVQACRRFGFCEHEAPGVFKLRSDGRLAHQAYISADQVDDVLRAATACPVRAIALRPIHSQRLTSPQHSGESSDEPGRVVPLRNRGQGRSHR